MTSPFGSGFSMPAEWAEHQRTLMAWPARVDLWGDGMEAAKGEYAAAARAIAAFEPVLVVAPPGTRAEVRDACGDVDVVELPIDDSWIRDSGPIFVTDVRGRLAGVDFRFNGWGEKFLPYDRDDAMPRALLEHLGVPRFEAPLVLEGGSVTVDGEGTLIATEQCLLNPNRNPELRRGQIELLLRDHLAAETVVWIEHGLVEDEDTDGHVDNVAAFVAPGVVLAQTVADPKSPNHERLAENAERLRAATDARGGRLEVIELDVLPGAEVRGRPGVVPYVNLYLANGAAIVPVAGDDPDRDAEVLARLGEILSPREIVGVPGRVLAEGGGGVHCITQQMPAAAA